MHEIVCYDIVRGRVVTWTHGREFFAPMVVVALFVVGGHRTPQSELLFERYRNKSSVSSASQYCEIGVQFLVSVISIVDSTIVVFIVKTKKMSGKGIMSDL